MESDNKHTSPPKLSVLIPSIPERDVARKSLMKKLDKQIDYCKDVHPSLGHVEIITVVSPAQRDGGENIGRKRQMCLDLSIGEYVCFIDDDDDIAPNYIEQLLRGCNTGFDVVTFKAIVMTDNYWGQVDMKLGHENQQMTPNGVVQRSPWHVCPHKREYAAQFTDSSYGEDWDYMGQVVPKLKTQHYIDQLLILYKHSNSVSRAQNN